MFETLLFLVLLFVMFRFFFGNTRNAALGDGASRGWPTNWQSITNRWRGWGQDDALELVRMRFAKGEISSKEFEKIQGALKD